MANGNMNEITNDSGKNYEQAGKINVPNIDKIRFKN